MKVYMLIHEQDTDAAWGCSAELFLNRQKAQDTMRESWNDTLQQWDFDTHEQTEEHASLCTADTALLRDGGDIEQWRIEEKEVDVQVVIESFDGLIQSIYANADLAAKVYYMDPVVFATESEQKQLQQHTAHLVEIDQSPDWLLLK